MVIQEAPGIKGYEVLEPIGQGAYGVVYRARQSSVDREVVREFAIPRFFRQLTPEERERFGLPPQV